MDAVIRRRAHASSTNPFGGVQFAFEKIPGTITPLWIPGKGEGAFIAAKEMFTVILYVLAIAGHAVSFFKDRKKTKLALKKAWKAFENILPQFLSILILIGLALAILSPEAITKLLGTSSGIWGVLAASVIGSITLIPGFVAFPLAAALLKNGAGYMQIAAFVSTLMMVGIVTMPLEIKTFGKRAAIVRNVAAFAFSLIAAFVIGVVL